MDVGVGDAGAHGAQHRGELPGLDALRRGAADDVVGVEGAVDVRRRSGACLGAGRAVAEVAAEEDHDAAVDAALGEVDVGLGHRALEVEVIERPIHRCAVVADGGFEPAAAGGRDGRHLVEGTEPGHGGAVGVPLRESGCGSDRNQDGEHEQLRYLAHRDASLRLAAR